MPPPTPAASSIPPASPLLEARPALPPLGLLASADLRQAAPHGQLPHHLARDIYCAIYAMPRGSFRTELVKCLRKSHAGAFPALAAAGGAAGNAVRRAGCAPSRCRSPGRPAERRPAERDALARHGGLRPAFVDVGQFVPRERVAANAQSERIKRASRVRRTPARPARSAAPSMRQVHGTVTSTLPNARRVREVEGFVMRFERQRRSITGVQPAARVQRQQLAKFVDAAAGGAVDLHWR